MPLKTKTVRALKKSVQSEAKSSKNIKNCIYNMISDIFKKINKTWGGRLEANTRLTTVLYDW